MRAPDSHQSIKLILLAAILLVVPALLVTSKQSFRLDGDYDAHLPLINYAIEYMQTHNAFPRINPLIADGMPVAGDPISPLLNPMFTIPLLAFGVENGLRIVIIIVFLLSGLTMYAFLTTLGVSGWPRVFGSLLAMSSGALAGRVTAGHVEQLFSYPLVPLVLIPFVTRPSISKFWVLGSLALALIVLSGDLYRAWFLVIFFIVSMGYHFIVHRPDERRGLIRSTLIFMFLFLLISSIKLMPFLRDVYPRMERFHPIDAFAGSIHIPLAIVPFIMPFQVSFYDRPTVQRTLGFYYNWYEYYSFITPLPFLFLVKWRKLLEDRHIRLLGLLFLAGTLYVAVAHPYSPFNWLFTLIPSLQSVRTPMRMFMPLTIIVIAILTKASEHYLAESKKMQGRRFVYTIFTLTLIWTFVTTHVTLTRAFAPDRAEDERLVNAIHSRDTRPFSVVSFLCCMQTRMASANMHIIDYYYGWHMRGTPHYYKGDEIDLTAFNTYRSTYVIAPHHLNLTEYDYEVYWQNVVFVVWRTDTPNIFPLNL